MYTDEVNRKFKDIKIGDWVSIKELNKKARVIDIKEKEYVVALSNGKLKSCLLSDIDKILVS